VTVYRIERVLSTMSITAIGIAIIAMLVTLIAGWAGLDISDGLWITVRLLPTIGLALGFLFTIAFVIVSAVRRTRAARDAAN
jgi:uncharacterized membrane protein